MADAAEARQPDKAAGSLDGVDHAEDAFDQLRIVRRLLEGDEIIIDIGETLSRLGKEVAQQFVHGTLSWSERQVCRHAVEDRLRGALTTSDRRMRPPPGEFGALILTTGIAPDRRRSLSTQEPGPEPRP